MPIPPKVVLAPCFRENSKGRGGINAVWLVTGVKIIAGRIVGIASIQHTGAGKVVLVKPLLKTQVPTVLRVSRPSATSNPAVRLERLPNCPTSVLFINPPSKIATKA